MGCDSFTCPPYAARTCYPGATPINWGSAVACNGVCDVAQCCHELSRLTSTNLLVNHSAGDIVIFVEQHIGNIGESLVIDWNEVNEETVVIASFGNSIVLQAPLQFDH